MKKPESLLEIVQYLSPECTALFVVPALREKKESSDYLYLLHKDIIKSEAPPRLVSIAEWQHLTYVWSAFKGRPSVVHYNWFEITHRTSILQVLFAWFCLALYKRFGGKIIWTIHNKESQSRYFKRFNHMLRNWISRRADLLRVHCETAAEEMSKELDVPRSSFAVLPHPRFPAYLLPRIAAIEAINQRFGFTLQTRNQIFLMFGNISPYKRILEVINIFQSLSANKKLLVVGPVKQGYLDYYRRLKKSTTSDKNNVFIHPRFVNEKVVPEFFNACDYCLFNYRQILTSGGVELARSYQKAIIAPEKGCLKELQGNEYVTLFKTDEMLKQLLADT